MGRARTPILYAGAPVGPRRSGLNRRLMPRRASAHRRWRPRQTPPTSKPPRTVRQRVAHRVLRPRARRPLQGPERRLLAGCARSSGSTATPRGRCDRAGRTAATGPRRCCPRAASWSPCSRHHGWRAPSIRTSGNAWRARVGGIRHRSFGVDFGDGGEAVGFVDGSSGVPDVAAGPLAMVDALAPDGAHLLVWSPAPDPRRAEGARPAEGCAPTRVSRALRPSAMVPARCPRCGIRPFLLLTPGNRGFVAERRPTIL